MSRLIDADDFRRILREIQMDAEHFDNEQRRNDIGSIMALLDKQPTAFDTEKVIKQLLDMRLIRVEQCCEDYEIEVMTESNFDDAIDIVKKGGVE